MVVHVPLILVFTSLTCHFVGIVKHLLIFGGGGGGGGWSEASFITVSTH